MSHIRKESIGIHSFSNSLSSWVSLQILTHLASLSIVPMLLFLILFDQFVVV